MERTFILYRKYIFLYKLTFFFSILLLYLAPLLVIAQDIYRSDQYLFKLNTITDKLNRPWGLAFLPNGDFLITERVGRLRIVKNGQLDPNPIVGLPKNIFVKGQGGLLDVAIHPEFATNNLVYISYAGGDENNASTEVAKGRLVNNNLEDTETIFIAEPKTEGSLHYGSRLVFAADGTLYITTGDRYDRLHDAQKPSNHLGSIIRINDDGTIPKDNPFLGHKTIQAEVYSYGHRNPQGITIRPSDQTIWSHEHGPRGGDEVNKLKPGANYGWPAITYGIDYSGEIISDKTHSHGMEQPIVYWDPSIAPSGMAFYTGNQFPQWKGNLFIGALVSKHLRRIVMKGDKIIKQEILLEGTARIRDVRNGPDGYLYILTDEKNGKLLRLEPIN
ncbi:MAG: PQQ-dependent sugar dehydrogenase [Gammaproteobacteria bacterium]|nr:PQQ-dependent sugar dehydrogenase [Gammaproteobacteria bacterium]